MIYIDGVSFGDNYSGHEVITVLRWTENFYTTGTNFSAKYKMVEYVKNHPYGVKTKYYRNGCWYDGEYVRVVDNTYLRTDANDIKADNLGELPEV